MSPYVIAEAAATHDGNPEQALRLITLAAAIGADACKFQWLSSPERLVARRRAPEYLDAYRQLAFPREWFPVLAEACTQLGLDFLCTSFLPEDVTVVADHVARFKISSFESTDVPFVALHGLWPTKPLIISAGMGADPAGSIKAYRAIALLSLALAQGTSASARLDTDITVLHCRSAYPCPDQELGLARLHRAFNGWRACDGFSDHSRNPRAGAYAVAAGARIVEFHVRLEDTSPGNADYAVARTPEEAREYVRLIREAELMLGDPLPGPSLAEVPFLRYRVGA